MDPPTDWVFDGGEGYYGLDLDGTNDNIDFTGTGFGKVATSIPGTWSMLFRFKMTSSAATRIFSGTGTGGTAPFMFIGLNQGGGDPATSIRVQLRDTSGNILSERTGSTSPQINDGNVHSMGVVKTSNSAGGIAVCIDGVPQSMTNLTDTGFANQPNWDTGIRFGTNSGATVQFFAGTLFDFRVLTREVSVNELIAYHRDFRATYRRRRTVLSRPRIGGPFPHYIHRANSLGGMQGLGL
jgi:hypothetical protein